MRTKRTQKLMLRSALALLALMVLSAGVYVELNKEKYLFPGPLSALSSGGEPLGGYTSHAEFELECGHCHAPIHCIEDSHCQDCHLDIARQRSEAQGLHALLPGTEQCNTCHVEHRGREADIVEFAYVNFNHQQLTGFSLERHSQDYAGQAMTCESCHAQNDFADETLDCLSCHAAAEHDDMASHLESYGADCTACHDGVDRMKDFDHADTYPLEGEHIDVDCQDCHQEQVFAGTARECGGCHTEPELHVGLFGLDCSRCHTAQAWAPAQLTEHVFLLDHGDDPAITCETCHVDSYTAYPCYSCHDAEEMKDFHAAEDIYAYENCIECHPTGRAGEATEQAQKTETNTGQ